MLLRRLACLALGCVLPLLAAAAPRSYVATVTYVTDGDTVWVRPSWGGAPLPLRVQGIDAPEICQTWGARAREALAARVLHRRVHVQTRGRDAYDRVLARLQASGHDVGGWLVASGLAWSSRFQGRVGPYEAQQAAARQARRGLWSDARPMEPRRFRKLHGPCTHPPR